MNKAGGGDQERQRRSYETGARWAKERMGRERPADAAALSRVNDSDIVVVRGTYDRVEQVLGALELPFVVVGADDVPRLELRPEQLLVVNCPVSCPGARCRSSRASCAAGGAS
jgi:hypothetical protein